MNRYILSFLLICTVIPAVRCQADDLRQTTIETAQPNPTLNAPQLMDEREKKIRDYWNSNEKKKAGKELDLWMATDKKNSKPYSLRAEFSCLDKRYSKCLGYAKTAIEKSPDCSDGYYWKGRALESMGKFLDAANEYRAALLSKTNRTDVSESLNRVLAQMGTSASTE